VAQIELEEKKRQEVVDIIVPPPSKRANFTLTAHPDKEELILLGGEYFNGQKVHYCGLGNSSAIINLANQFRVYAHWSSSDGVDTHTAQRKFVFTLVLAWHCTLICTIQLLCLVWISMWDII